ncbi:SUKH superfamily protein [Chitinophaga niastensis]|uniref:SUKH superfamily protein n=1 Tax=Chitinophaga niastensis TaxID=536980 RepID=A0A2P8H805_CHINA|nr:SMI1/KNR4 family protein [Chitinophaga niastensis]PSL42365.1 SUKH superfamily protein [Chitinophaga niastensis]
MKEDIFNIINEINKFSPMAAVLGEPIIDNRVSKFEEEFGVKLPEDFKLFISEINGFSLMGTEVYGIYFDDKNPNTLGEIYKYEHRGVQVPMPNYLVPFSPDGGGNYYCFDTRIIENDSCPIVFFETHYIYQHDTSPAVTNNSFVDWVNEVVLDSTLEDYNYDGSPREEA